MHKTTSTVNWIQPLAIKIQCNALNESPKREIFEMKIIRKCNFFLHNLDAIANALDDVPLQRTMAQKVMIVP